METPPPQKFELTHACIMGDLQKVREILKHPAANVNERNDLNGDTCLIIAVYYDYLEITQELLKHPDIDPNLCNHKGEVALATACTHGWNIDVLYELVKHPRINLKAKSKTDTIPLFDACINRSYEFVVAILKYTLMSDPEFPFPQKCYYKARLLRTRLVLTLISPRIITRLGKKSRFARILSLDVLRVLCERHYLIVYDD